MAGIYSLPQLGLVCEIPISSGMINSTSADKIGGKVFGQCWNTGDKKLSFELSDNLSEKVGADRMGLDLTFKDFPRFKETILTKHKVLGSSVPSMTPVDLSLHLLSNSRFCSRR